MSSCCTNYVLQNHIKLVHENGKVMRHFCEICTHTFSSSGNLTSHINTVHMNIKRFKCEICGREFKVKMSLKLHKEKCLQEKFEKCKKAPM